MRTGMVIISLACLALGSLLSAETGQQYEKTPKGQLYNLPLAAENDEVTLSKYSQKQRFFTVDFEGHNENISFNGSWKAIDGYSDAYTEGRIGIVASSNLAETYASDADEWLIFSTGSMPAGARIYLSFTEWFELESDYDWGIIRVSADGGNSWRDISRRSGKSDWRETKIDLSHFAGKAIQLGFNLVSDDSINFAGWKIDDVSLMAVKSEPLSARMASLNHQNFPYIYMNVAVDTFGLGYPDLTRDNFAVSENGINQTEYFDVTPPLEGGGVRLADIVIILDVTGSMGDEIESVRRNLQSFANALGESGIDYGIGFIVFGDIIRSYNTGNFYYNQTEILSIINNVELGEQGIGDGGDGPENQLEAMATAASFNFRPGAQKVGILLTDASAHASDSVTSWTVDALLDLLLSTNLAIFPVFNTSSTAQMIQYVPIAEQTNANGSYFHVYDNFNEIIDEIGSTISNTYLVRYKSSDPVFNGLLREVKVTVQYKGNSALCEGSYTPGAMPRIQRTAATLELHNRAWAEETPFTIEASIEDDVTPYLQSATLYYRKTGTTAFSATPMQWSEGTIYQGIIPSSAVFTPGVDYYLVASDGLSSASDPSVDPGNEPYQIAILPNVAPIITHTPPRSLTPGSAINISAALTDNTNFISSAALYFRVTGQLLYQKAEMVPSSGSIYTATIPSNYVRSDGVEYYIKAVDDFGVSGYMGSPDAPISIFSLLKLVEQKKAIIDYFVGHDFYVSTEQDALTYVNQLTAKINNNTISDKEVDALKRLMLVEEAAQIAYPGAIKIADLTSKATTKLATTVILAALFGEMQKILEPVKNIPVLNLLYKAAKGTKEQFAKIHIHFLRKAVGHVAGNLWPKLMAKFSYLSQPEALSIADKLAWAIVPKLEEVFADLAADKIASMDPIVDAIGGIYLSVYESGLPGGIISIGGTKYSLSFSLSDAKSGNFRDGNTDVTINSVRTLNEPNIARNNLNVENAISSKIKLSEISQMVILILTIVAAVAGLIYGIATCPASAGIGCVISVASGLGIWGALHTLNTFFTATQIFLYSFGMGEGVYRLDFSLPGQLEEVRELAFDKSPSGVAFRLADGDHNSRQMSSIAVRWADSLTTIGGETAGKLTEIRSLLEAQRWDDAGASYDLLGNTLTQLDRIQKINNAILDVVYLNNSDFIAVDMDSIYHRVSAYSSASDFALGSAEIAIGFGLLLHPAGVQLDSLLMIVDESISRLNQSGPAFKQAFELFNANALKAPSIIAITSCDLEPYDSGFSALVHIMNIADVAVHDVAVTLKPITGNNLTVTALSDTLFSIMNPGGEQTLQWRISGLFTETILLLEVAVNPQSLPGDFIGSRDLISEIIPSDSGTQEKFVENNYYAYPNPFNPAKENAVIVFKLGKSSRVTVKVYDSAVKLVDELCVELPMDAGVTQSISWDGRNSKNELVGNGVYFYRITTSDGERMTGKLAVLQ